MEVQSKKRYNLNCLEIRRQNFPTIVLSNNICDLAKVTRFTPDNDATGTSKVADTDPGSPNAVGT